MFIIRLPEIRAISNSLTCLSQIGPCTRRLGQLQQLELRNHTSTSTSNSVLHMHNHAHYSTNSIWLQNSAAIPGITVGGSWGIAPVLLTSEMMWSNLSSSVTRAGSLMLDVCTLQLQLQLLLASLLHFEVGEEWIVLVFACNEFALSTANKITIFAKIRDPGHILSTWMDALGVLSRPLIRTNDCFKSILG